MPSFDTDAYRHAVRQLADEVYERMGAGMSMRSALYRSLGGCVFDLWNRDVLFLICELSEQEPEIDVVNDVVTEDTSDTQAITKCSLARWRFRFSHRTCAWSSKTPSTSIPTLRSSEPTVESFRSRQYIY